jgi:hypothetical protein
MGILRFIGRYQESVSGIVLRKGGLDLVSEVVSILSQAEIFKPICNIHERISTNFTTGMEKRLFTTARELIFGDLIAEVYEEQNSKRIAEIRALEMQFNPHFLYNTLDTIKGRLPTGLGVYKSIHCCPALITGE